MRIVSLLPSATEIVYALGLQDSLAAVTHECDYPADALKKPKITKNVLPEGLSSAQIDEAIRQQVHQTGSPYALDFDLLRELQPDLILTQKLCHVCAVSYDQVTEAVKSLPNDPKVVNLEPTSLAEVLAQIEEVAELAGAASTGRQVAAALKKRVDLVCERAKKAATKPRAFFLEGLDPPYVAGHWTPELIRLAGGYDPLGREGKYSVAVAWEEIVEYNPDVLILGCCGFGIERIAEEAGRLMSEKHWQKLGAVQKGEIYITDGSAYFSRPGPRIVDSLEILAAIFHPELFPDLDANGKFVKFMPRFA